MGDEFHSVLQVTHDELEPFDVIAYELSEPTWTEEEDTIFKEFITTNPRIKSKDARTKKVRDRLWSQLVELFNGKFEVEYLEVKLLDLSGKWRPGDVEQLIDFYRGNEQLWNCSLAEYHNKSRKNALLEELSRQIDCRKTGKEVQEKFENLKTTFVQMDKKGKTGDGAKSKQPWPYFDYLVFLRKVVGQRNSFSNFHQDNDEYESSQQTSNPFSPGSASSADDLEPARKRNKNSKPTSEHEFQQKIIQSLQSSQSGNEAFGVSMANSLNQFTDENQEYVKLQLQAVLVECLKCQKLGLEIPSFRKIND